MQAAATPASMPPRQKHETVRAEADVPDGSITMADIAEQAAGFPHQDALAGLPSKASRRDVPAQAA